MQLRSKHGVVVRTNKQKKAEAKTAHTKKHSANQTPIALAHYGKNRTIATKNIAKCPHQPPTCKPRVHRPTSAGTSSSAAGGAAISKLPSSRYPSC